MASTVPARHASEVSGVLVDRIRHRLVSTAGSSDDPALASIVRDEAAVLADDVVLAELRREVAAELAGAGPLEHLLELPGITDVMVNGPSEVWLDRGFGIERVAVTFPDDAAVRRLAQRLAAGAGWMTPLPSSMRPCRTAPGCMLSCRRSPRIRRFRCGFCSAAVSR